MSRLVNENNGIDFKNSDIRILDALFINDGYVLDYTNNTFAELFEDEININIYDEKYSNLGDSKGNRLRTFIQIDTPQNIKKILNALWEKLGKPDAQKNNFKKLIDKINGTDIISTEGIDKFEQNQTLNDLIIAIKRDIDADSPQVAIDRLHTYCVKRFKYLLKKHDIDHNNGEPLHSLTGKYKQYLDKSEDFQRHRISLKIIKASNQIWQEFNDIRNNHSPAHDNPMLTVSEARYIFETMTAILRFIRYIENN